MNQFKRLWSERPALPALLLLCVLGFFGTCGIRRHLEKTAQESLVAVQKQELPALQSTLDALTERAKSAQRVHSAAYLKDFSLQTAVQDLAAAQAAAAAGTKASDPDEIRAKVAQARKQIAAAKTELAQRENYLDTLDIAKREYKVRMESVSNASSESRKYIAALLASGYAERHFTTANQKLDEVDRDLVQLQSNSGDYLAIWQGAQALIDRIKEANQKAEAIPQLRDANLQQIAVARQRIADVAAKVNQAQDARNNLAQYTRYSNQQVANYDLSGPRLALQTAEKLNGTEIPDFTGAAQQITTAKNSIEAAAAAADSAVSQWSEVRQARSLLGGKKAEATSAIDRAQDEINHYTWNSQGNAIVLLNTARDNLRQGKDLEDDDPLASRSRYDAAGESARSAYNAVNRHQQDTDDDDANIPIVIINNDNHYGGSHTRSDSVRRDSGTMRRDSTVSRPTGNDSRDTTVTRSTPPPRTDNGGWKQAAPQRSSSSSGGGNSGGWKQSAPTGGGWKKK